MMKLTIKDSDLVSDILMHLIAQVDRGEHSDMRDLNEEQLQSVDKLAKLLAKDVIRLVNSGQIKINAHLDMGSLANGLKRLDGDSDEIKDLIYFIEHSATTRMLNRLFDTSDEIISGYRQMLNVGRKSGRVPLADIQIREAIHSHWYEQTKGKRIESKKSLRTLLRTTHEKFNHVSLDMLYATINEFKE